MRNADAAATKYLMSTNQRDVFLDAYMTVAAGTQIDGEDIIPFIGELAGREIAAGRIDAPEDGTPMDDYALDIAKSMMRQLKPMANQKAASLYLLVNPKGLSPADAYRISHTDTAFR